MQYLTTEQLQKAFKRIDALEQKLDKYMADMNDKFVKYRGEIAQQISFLQSENEKLKNDLTVLRVTSEERRQKAIEQMKSE